MNTGFSNKILFICCAFFLLSACGKEGKTLNIIPDTGQGELSRQEISWDGIKRSDISYQVLVYSFADGDGDGTGDFKGIESRLDYLADLGVSALWLSPIHPSSSYHGYDVLDYEAVNPLFGTENDFRNLLEAAHGKGMKIYLDYVLNHTSSGHPWFLEAKSNPDSPYRDYYIFSKNPQQDIADGMIPQISTEGSAGYDSGQWYSTESGAGASGRFSFCLDWTGTSPVITVTRTDSQPDSPSEAGNNAKYLYFGNEMSVPFNDNGDGTYELVLDFESDWGFLVRTSADSWAAGTKYGAASAADIIEFGKPFTLHSNASGDCSNIQFSLPLMYHSHFWTPAFADLNYGPAAEAEKSPAFAALTQAAEKWIEMGVDGFRLDAVKHIYHNAFSNENPVFLKKFYDSCNLAYKAAGGEGDFYMVGEMLDGSDNAAPYYAGLPALFEFDFWYKLKWALQNGTGRYFAKDILAMQQKYSQYRSDCIEATKLSNHDEDRTGSELGKSRDKMKLAAAVLLTSQGSPYIYQGEELGYWGTKQNGDEYVRTPILWDKTGGSAATAGVNGKYDRQMLTPDISVESQRDDENSVLSSYIYFARLRNTYPALAGGKMSKHGVYNENKEDGNAIAAWYMTEGEEKILVVHNFGNSEEETYFSDDLSNNIGLQGKASVQTSGSMYKLTLGACSSAIFLLQQHL